MVITLSLVFVYDDVDINERVRFGVGGELFSVVISLVMEID